MSRTPSDKWSIIKILLADEVRKRRGGGRNRSGGGRPGPPPGRGGGRARWEPVERVARDLDEAPAHRAAAIVLAELDDVPPVRAADLPRVILLHRVTPQNVPGIDPGVVDPQGRAVEIRAG